jgi:hypothetical protein
MKELNSLPADPLAVASHADEEKMNSHKKHKNARKRLNILFLWLFVPFCG